MKRRRRSDVDYMEFRDGYVLVKRAELEAVIEGYKHRDLNTTAQSHFLYKSVFAPCGCRVFVAS